MTDSVSFSDPAALLASLGSRLREEPARLQLVAGPRQVGKTTALLKLEADWRGRAFYAAADAPEASRPGFWERYWADLADASRARGPVLALLDEVHLLPEWAATLKGHWDRLRRQRLPIHVVATGSSSLRVNAGARESLAGRFERLALTHWSVDALARVFMTSESNAARRVVAHGGYPGAWPLLHDLPRWRAYLRDAIIEPAIGRDVLALAEVRRPALLRQVFAVAVSLPAAIVSLQKLQGALAGAGAIETIAQYLRLLEDAYLVASLEKFSEKAMRRRAAPPKLVTLNNAILTTMHPQGAPEEQTEPARFGAWVENACLAAAVNQGQQVRYWREEPFEVDAVIEGSWGRWAVEVKTGTFGIEDLRGLFEFTRRHPSFRPLVVTKPGQESRARHVGIDATNWIEFLRAGPAH